jgi:hypothetical protein
MKSYGPERVINGTWGEVWIDGEYMAEVTALEATMSLEKTEVSQTRTLAKGQKVTGTEGKGTITMNKVTSFALRKIGECVRANKTPPAATVISKLDDPDGFGAERVQINGVTFDEVAIVNWEAKKLGEEKIPFTFRDYTPLDLIPEV